MDTFEYTPEQENKPVVPAQEFQPREIAPEEDVMPDLMQSTAEEATSPETVPEEVSPLPQAEAAPQPQTGWGWMPMV